MITFCLKAVLLVASLLISACTQLHAQAYRWQKVYESGNRVPVPEQIGFANENFGLLQFKSKVLSRVNDTQFIRSFQTLLTTDGGQTWKVRLDTNIYSPGGSGNSHFDFPGASSFGTYIYPDTSGLLLAWTTANGTTNGSNYPLVFLTDTGRNGSIGYNFSPMRGATSTRISSLNYVSPSTVFFIINDVISLYYKVTRDTAKSYAAVCDSLKLGNYGDNLTRLITSTCMYDSATAWVFVQSILEGGPFLLHTTTSGNTWETIYPFSHAPISSVHLEPWDGISLSYSQDVIQGAEKNTVFLPNVRLDRVDERDTIYQRLKRVLGLVLTTDGGKSWQCDTAFHERIRSLCNPSDSSLWCVCENGENPYYGHKDSVLLHSTNFGKTWEYDSTSFNNEHIQMLYWQSATNGYVVTYQDSIVRIYKYMPSSSVSRGEALPPEISIYPNPATKTVTIASIEQPSPFRIYDVLGREVLHGMTLDRAPLTLDVSHVARGVYYLFVDSPRTGRAVMAGKILLAEE